MDTSTQLATGDTSTLSGFAFGVTFSIGLFLLIILIIIAWCLCARRQRNTQESVEEEAAADSVAPEVKEGVDEASLSQYPKFLYSKAKARENGESEESCCSICLTDFKDDDTVRLLPSCGHLFHQDCIDQWLRTHASCPICRKSPLVSDQVTTPVPSTGVQQV